MDEAIPIPGTDRRIGLDALVGLFLPGVGDALGAGTGALLLVVAFVSGVPGVVILRMALNLAIDALVGLVPVAGDLFDFAWKANTRNVALIERFAVPGARPRPTDYALVGASLAFALAVVAAPLWGAAWVLSWVLGGG